jgi:hypothetical protein
MGMILTNLKMNAKLSFAEQQKKRKEALSNSFVILT